MRSGARVADRSRGGLAVPPFSLLLAGGLLGLAVVVAAVAAGFYLAGWPFPGASVVTADDVLVAGVAALVAGALWWAVVARSRTAWLALLVLVTGASTYQLWTVSTGATGFGGLPVVALAVLALLTLSAAPVRAWVMRGRRDPQVRLPDPGARS